MEIDSLVIKRFLDKNEIDKDEELILDWFSDIRAESDLRKKYRAIWDEIDCERDLKSYDGDKILNGIYHEIKLKESRLQPRSGVLNRFADNVTKVAAILFIPLVAYLFITRDQIFSLDSQAAYTEIFSPHGTRTKFYLPDGSIGWLNVDSYLEFPTEFKGRSREIVLKGEAFFNVVPNKRKPFIVTGPDISIVAYGTSFNVLAYPDDRISEVTLAEGSIGVGHKQNGKIQNERMLQPDQVYIYDRLTFSNNVMSVDADRIISWTQGKLVFKDDTFKEVVKRLNRWYNVNIVIRDEILESYVYMATFEDETLDEVLKLLKLSAPIEYKDLGRERNEDGTFTKRKIELYYNAET